MFSVRYRLTLAILSILGTVTILLFTRPSGAGLSPDSVGYIATARHIASGIGVVTYDGAPLLQQPPLYPALLAAIEIVLGIDPLSSARIVNAILFGFIVYLSGLLFLKHLNLYPFSLLGAASLLVAFPLVRVSLMAWSEPLFIFFTVLYLILSESYLEKSDIPSLLLLSLATALACLTRFIGVIFIITSVVSMLFFRRDERRVNFWHLFIFVSVTALPIGMWILRNYFLSGTFWGPRASSSYTLSQNLTFAFNTFLPWYIPSIISDHRSVLVLMSATIGFLVGLGTRGIDLKRIRVVLSEIIPLLLFVITYVGFLVITSTITAYDRIGDRLLSPVFVPMTLLILLLASKVLTSLARQRLSQKCINISLTIAIAVWLVYPAYRVIVSTEDLRKGLGFSNDFWRNSETINYLLQNRTLGFDCTIYTNGPDALYILANLTGKMSPERTMYNSPDIVNDLSSLRGSWPEENKACLVWFDRIDRSYLFTVDELRTIVDMQQIIRLEDGVIYFVTKR